MRNARDRKFTMLYDRIDYLIITRRTPHRRMVYIYIIHILIRWRNQVRKKVKSTLESFTFTAT